MFHTPRPGIHALGGSGHHAILDAVVDHLHEVAGARQAPRHVRTPAPNLITLFGEGP
jgi:hypothetical protein